MSPVEPIVTFRLGRHGWADLLIDTAEERHCISNISYIGDALDDLLRLGIVIATGRHVATAEFFHEPGSTLLVAETSWWVGETWEVGARLGAVELSGFRQDELAPESILRLPRRFSTAFSSADALATALLRAAEAVETEHGNDGYNALWNGARGFPVRAVAALRAALAAPPNERLRHGG